MKFIAPFKLLLLSASIFLLHTTSVLADGVAGSGSGTHLTFIVLTLIAIVAVFVTIPILTKLKSHSAARIVTHAAGKDTFWNADTLKKHAEKTFYSMQEAWETRSLDKVKDLVDKELYTNYSSLLDAMINRKEKNILTQIQIDDIRIIGIEDYIDNSKDRYVAYIQGRLLDYVIHEETQEVIKNSSKTLRNIAESYHFVRGTNNWILEKIDNTVTMQDILQAKNFMEE